MSIHGVILAQVRVERVGTRISAERTLFDAHFAHAAWCVNRPATSEIQSYSTLAAGFESSSQKMAAAISMALFVSLGISLVEGAA
jgi:hypothetical protein